MPDLAVAQNLATNAPMIVPVGKLLTGGAAMDLRGCVGCSHRATTRPRPMVKSRR
jgi:hypothetical protein